MRRTLSWLLLVLMIAAGCRAGSPGPAPETGTLPEPAPQSESPPVQRPTTSTPPTPLPANEVQLPATPPSVSLEPAEVLQGDLAVLRFDRPVEGEVKVVVEGLSEQPKVYRLEGKPVAFLGFPAATREGSYPVQVTWPDGSWEGSVTVVRKEFTEDRLVVTEEQQAVYFDPRQQEEWKKVFRVRSRSEERPLWRGAFRVPLDGDLKVTTYFGEIRFVNGVETGRHSGMDFGAPTGTPILAPARGKVVLAEELIVTGWTIIIDHGFNLFTAYYHLDQVGVSPAEWVDPGQPIGTVGNTGFSTGPHLHWTATIGNLPVDPWPLTQSPVMGIRPLSQRAPADLEE